MNDDDYGPTFNTKDSTKVEFPAVDFAWEIAKAKKKQKRKKYEAEPVRRKVEAEGRTLPASADDGN